MILLITITLLHSYADVNTSSGHTPDLNLHIDVFIEDSSIHQKVTLKSDMMLINPPPKLKMLVSKIKKPLSRDSNICINDSNIKS